MLSVVGTFAPAPHHFSAIAFDKHSRSIHIYDRDRDFHDHWYRHLPGKQTILDIYKAQCLVLLKKAGWVGCHVETFEQAGWKIRWDEVIYQKDGHLCGFISCLILWRLASQQQQAMPIVLEGGKLEQLSASNVPRAVKYSTIRGVVIKQLCQWIADNRDTLQIYHTGSQYEQYEYVPHSQAPAQMEQVVEAAPIAPAMVTDTPGNDGAADYCIGEVEALHGEELHIELMVKGQSNPAVQQSQYNNEEPQPATTPISQAGQKQARKAEKANRQRERQAAKAKAEQEEKAAKAEAEKEEQEKAKAEHDAKVEQEAEEKKANAANAKSLQRLLKKKAGSKDKQEMKAAAQQHLKQEHPQLRQWRNEIQRMAANKYSKEAYEKKQREEEVKAFMEGRRAQHPRCCQHETEEETAARLSQVRVQTQVTRQQEQETIQEAIIDDPNITIEQEIAAAVVTDIPGNHDAADCCIGEVESLHGEELDIEMLKGQQSGAEYRTPYPNDNKAPEWLFKNHREQQERLQQSDPALQQPQQNNEQPQPDTASIPQPSRQSTFDDEQESEQYGDHVYFEEEDDSTVEVDFDQYMEELPNILDIPENDACETPVVESRREGNIFRQQTFDDSTDEAISFAFPNVFMLGTAYGRATGRLNKTQMHHLLTQFHQTPSKDRRLLLYVFDNKRRAETNFGVKALAKGSSKCFQELAKVVNSPGFADKLEYAKENPDSKEATDLLKLVHRCLTIAGKNQVLGSHELRYVVPRIKEISKTVGSPGVFLTCALEGKNNPRALRLAQAVVDNDRFPASIFDDTAGTDQAGSLGKFIDYLAKNGYAARSDHLFNMPLDPSTRAATAIDNPVAYVQEFMSVVNAVLSTILGIPPENFFAQSHGKKRRRKQYVVLKGAFGRTFSYYGVIEANDRGELHFHLVLFGSLPPHLLHNFATFPNVRQAIMETLQSYYKSELQRPTHIYKRLCDIMHDRRKHQLSYFDLDKNRTPPLCKPKPHLHVDKVTTDSISALTELQSCQQEVHRHLMFTCSKGCLGLTGCRFCRPFPINATTSVVKLLPREALDDGSYPMDDGGEGDNCWIVEPVSNDCTIATRSPLDAPDRTIYYWDLCRPAVTPLSLLPFEGYAAYKAGTLVFSDAEAVLKKEEIITILESLVAAPPSAAKCGAEIMVPNAFFSWMRQALSLDEIVEIYELINVDLEDGNGYVVEHSPIVSYCTGSHNNATPLGSSEQGKAAAFYLGPYFMKSKFDLQQCLVLFCDVQKHNDIYKSTATDVDTNNNRATMYFLERVLNKLSLLMEVSDCQAAAALLGLPTEIRSDNLAYVGPHESIAYMQHRRLEELRKYDDDNEDEVSDYDYDDPFIVDSDSSDGEMNHAGMLHDSDYDDNDADDDNEDNIDNDESDDSILYHSHTPQSQDDIINDGIPAQFGYSKIWTVDDNIKVPIPACHHYFYRGKGLEVLNLLEYTALVQVMEKPKKDHCDKPTTKARQARSVFDIHPGCELHAKFCQKLKTKQDVPFVCGQPPPRRPGVKPDQMEGETQHHYHLRIANWTRRANKFAQYYLMLFRPMKDITEMTQSDFTMEALMKWIETLQKDHSWLSEFRLVMLNHRLNGMSVSFKSKKTISAYRGRNRTIWSDQQRQRQRQLRHLEFQASHADIAEVDAAVFNAEHKVLSEEKVRNMRHQTEDIRRLNKVMQKCYSAVQQKSKQSKTKTVTKQKAESLCTSFDPHLATSILEELDDMDDIEMGHDNLSSSTYFHLPDHADPLKSSTYNLEGVQAQVFDEVVKHLEEPGRSGGQLLATGPAGTGKTVLIKAVLNAAHSQKKKFIRTSFNALVALAIGGDTFSGTMKWNPQQKHNERSPPFTAQEQDAFLRRNGLSKETIDSLFGIILDEISTFSPEMISLLDYRLRQITENHDEPFGGLLVLFVGDFGQLGAVLATAIPVGVMDSHAFRQKRMQNMQDIKSQSGQTASPHDQYFSSSVTSEKFERYRQHHPFTVGVDRMTEFKWYNITKQQRAKNDVKHLQFVEKMYHGKKLVFGDFNNYKQMDPSTITEEEWQDAPVLVTTNRERLTVTETMAKIRATQRDTIVVRWPSQVSAFWEQKPDECHMDEVRQDAAFWEYFVAGSIGYVTDNLNKSLGVVNGACVRFHSLSFASNDIAQQFQNLLQVTPIGSVLTLEGDMIPTTVNVELLNPDNTNIKLEDWPHGMSLLKDKVVIPLPALRKFGGDTKPVVIPGGKHYPPSRVKITNTFPVEAGFAVTNHKVQGRTLKKVIIALSKRLGTGCNMSYASIYVAFSRTACSEDIRLLLTDPDSSRCSLEYLNGMEADPCNAAFFAGFDEFGENWSGTRALAAYRNLTGKDFKARPRTYNKKPPN